MSQNRQEYKGQKREVNDYKVELEIKLLQEKIDHLILLQSKRLTRI